MDLQPSGNKKVELVALDTEKISLTIKGNYEKLPRIYEESIFQSNVSINCFLEDEIIDAKLYSNGPLFYEHENYEIVIESKGDYNVEFFMKQNNKRKRILSYKKQKNFIWNYKF
ncbi:hypothetical protein EXQ31_07425 [Clostridium botulinum]|nr:hypothetical protein [Clostridium botulinum]